VRRVACVFAHPDDDTFGVSGSLALHAQDELELTVLLATSGEAGRIADASLATRETLASVREAEDLASWRALGLEPDLRFLRHPDGGVNAIPRGELVAEVRGVLEEVAPEVVVTFGPDGITGHPDHVAVSRWTTDAWVESGRQGSLVYATTTGAFTRRHAVLHERLGLFPPGYPRPAGDDELVLEVKLDVDELRRKRAALAAHASQTDPLALAMGEPAFTQWWATESFRRPRPAELALAEAS
jgi:LmbE family N-acetylglucosaminyl deacetylase